MLTSMLGTLTFPTIRFMIYESGFWQAKSAVAISQYEAEAKSSGLGGLKFMSEHHQHEHKIEVEIVTTVEIFRNRGSKGLVSTKNSKRCSRKQRNT